MNGHAKVFLTIVVFILSLINVNISEATLVNNGGFETGDFTGWEKTPAVSGSLFDVDDTSPNSGNYGAYFGAIYNLNDSISQVIATTPGTSYLFEFWLDNTGVGNNSFEAFWGGNQLLNLQNVDEFIYNHYIFNVEASGSTTVIGFTGSNKYSYFDLDGVSVNPVPEPSTIFLLSFGIGGLALFRKRNKL